ncbi:MAG: hypothetical protein M3348_06540 [Acidobacteriota bacterium]|nr:hypothetical protein [Acidobacteriota bacterium]
MRRPRSDRGRRRKRRQTDEQRRVVELKKKIDPDTGKPYTDAVIASALFISTGAVTMRRYRDRKRREQDGDN